MATRSLQQHPITRLLTGRKVSNHRSDSPVWRARESLTAGRDHSSSIKKRAAGLSRLYNDPDDDFRIAARIDGARSVPRDGCVMINARGGALVPRAGRSPSASSRGLTKATDFCQFGINLSSGPGDPMRGTMGGEPEDSSAVGEAHARWSRRRTPLAEWDFVHFL